MTFLSAVTAPAFRALLQIRAVRKKTAGSLSPVSFSPVLSQSSDHTEHSVKFTIIFHPVLKLLILDGSTLTEELNLLRI